MRRGWFLALGLFVAAATALWWHSGTTPVQAQQGRGVQWIWFNEGTPVREVPSETRYFRRTFTIDRPVQKVVDEADLDITADNAFTVWVNGALVGKGND